VFAPNETVEEKTHCCHEARVKDGCLLLGIKKLYQIPYNYDDKCSKSV
jgi:hypothetical protein